MFVFQNTSPFPRLHPPFYLFIEIRMRMGAWRASVSVYWLNAACGEALKRMKRWGRKLKMHIIPSLYVTFCLLTLVNIRTTAVCQEICESRGPFELNFSHAILRDDKILSVSCYYFSLWRHFINCHFAFYKNVYLHAFNNKNNVFTSSLFFLLFLFSSYK